MVCIAFAICFFMSCQTRKNNIELTDFTRELISLYINDPDNFDMTSERGKIIITSNTNKHYHCLSIYFHPRSIYYDYDFGNGNFVGQTTYLGHLIRVYGDESSIFYSVKDKINTQRRRRNGLDDEWNPNVWTLCLHYDMSFCKMRTSKRINNQDVSAMQNLVEKHFRVPRSAMYHFPLAPTSTCC